MLFNGEGCEDPVCNTNYRLHPTQEFVRGALATEFNSRGRVTDGAALFGTRGLEATSSFDQAKFQVTEDVLIPSQQGSVCMIVRNAGVPADSRYRLFIAQEPSARSYVSLEFHSGDDLALRYRDHDQTVTTLSTAPWNGADSHHTMLIQASYDAGVEDDSLRIVVDGVPRGVHHGAIHPLGPINELRVGNSSANAGAFHIDPILVSGRGDVDCWKLMAGTCSSTLTMKCVDDAHCPLSETCKGVKADYEMINDECPDDPDKLEPGICGCNIPDVDLDGDAAVDCPSTCLDADGDGYGSEPNDDCLGLDCDDLDATIHPGAFEIACDGIDNDCNPDTIDLVDDDRDGFTCDVDCDDLDQRVHPGHFDIACDGLDNDCDPITPDVRDADGDYIDCHADCDDGNATIHPGAVELACDGLDNDCDLATPDNSDVDLDGATCDVDCNDTNADIHPGAFEIDCDGIDNDCDAGTPDIVDRDQDGATCELDCNDADAATHPGAIELLLRRHR